jgi:hypothetical protein
MDAAFTSQEQHEGGIHVVPAWRRRRAASDRKASEDLRMIGDGNQTKEVRA